MHRSPFEGSGPVVPAHAFDVVRVGDYLAAAVPGFTGPMEVTQFSGGQSNPTFRLATPGGTYVLRRKPPGPLLRTAHAVDREYRVTRALHARGFPVARPLAYCDDPTVMETPFFVMEYVGGRIFWDPALRSLPGAERRGVWAAMAGMMANLHAIPLDEVGLGDYGRRGDYFARQIARWSEQYLAAKTREIRAMTQLMAWLRDHGPRPSGREAIIHGDVRLDNVIFDAHAPVVRAVIDWELSTSGDPMADLSYLAMVWHLPAGAFGSLAGVELASEGLPTEEEFVGWYLDQAGGKRPDDWAASIVYNLFRLAAILEGVARRAIEGNAASRRAAEMAALVEPIADAAWALARRL